MKHFIIAGVAALAISSNSAAQQQNTIADSANKLKELVVTATRNKTESLLLPFTVNVLGRKN